MRGGFISDSQRRACFFNLSNRFTLDRGVRFSEAPFDSKKTLELLEAGMMDPSTLTDEQKSLIEVVQEEQHKARSKALKALNERIERGDTYRPKELWSDDPTKIRFKGPQVIKVRTRQPEDDVVVVPVVVKDPKELDIRVKRFLDDVDEGKFSNSEEMAKIEGNLEKVRRSGEMSVEEYDSIKRVLEMMKRERVFSKLSSEEFEELRKKAEAGPGTEAWDKFQRCADERRADIDKAEKNLTAEDLIEKQKIFRSTRETPSPSGTGLDELAAVVAGTKSATIISDPRSAHDSRFNELLDKAKESGLTIIKYPESDYGGGIKASVYVVGVEPNASIVRSYLDKEESDYKFGIPYKISKEDEIIVSRALGYSPEAIEDYIKKRYQ
jgi:hypothetical protein